MITRTDGRVHVNKSQRVANAVTFKRATRSPPTPVVVSGHLCYEVDDVLDQRGDGSAESPVEYKVTWKGYPESANSWIQRLPAFFRNPGSSLLDTAKVSKTHCGDGSSSGGSSGGGSGSSVEAAAAAAAATAAAAAAEEQGVWRCGRRGVPAVAARRLLRGARTCGSARRHG